MTEAIATNGTATKAVATNGHAPATQVLRMVALSQIVASKTNPRQHFDPTDLRELADSIKELGVVSPITLRPIKGKADVYEIVAGERRFRASKLAEATEIPAIVRDLTDKQALEIQMIENLQRKDLSPLEEADGLARMVRDHGYKPKELADKIGKSATYVLRHLKLADLHPKLRIQLEREELPVAHAMLLARLPDQAIQLEARKEIDGFDGVRPLKESAKRVSAKYILPLDKAPFDISDKVLVAAVGSCTDCPHRSGNAGELFDDVKEKNMCTKPSCYQAKVTSWWKNKETKEVKLPLAQSEAIFWPHGGIKNDAKYYDLAEEEYWMKKGETYGSLTKLKVTPILAMDTVGRVRKIALKKDVDTVLKAMKRGPSNGPRSSGSSRPKLSAAEKKRVEDRKIGEACGDRIKKAVFDACAMQADKISDSQYYPLVMDFIIDGAMVMDWLQLRGVKTKYNDDAAARKVVASLKRTEHRGALLQLALFGIDCFDGHTPNDRKRIDDVCMLLKIDVAKIRKEVRAELEKKAKAAPAAKVAGKAKKK